MCLMKALLLTAMTGLAQINTPSTRPRKLLSREEAIHYLRRHVRAADRDWLQSATLAQLKGCQVEAKDGTVLFMPDGSGHYRALWTRDFAYMVRRAGDWFYCLSGYLTPPEKRSSLSRSRWNMDRQSYLSMWREGSGLIVGGGNSQHQPELATFEIRTGPLSLCQPDRAEPRQENGWDILRLVYGDTTTELRLRPVENGVELVFALVEKGPNTKEILGGFMLPCMVNESIRTSGTEGEVMLAPAQVWGEAW